MEETKNKLVAFRVSEDDQAYKLFEDVFSQRGPSGRKNNHLKAWFHISCLALPGSPTAWIAADLAATWAHSCKISQRFGKEMRSLDSLRAKFIEETSEFHDSLRIADPFDVRRLNRLANIIYYLVQLYSQHGDIHDFYEQLNRFSVDLGNLPLKMAVRLAMVKFDDRASREIKNVAYEEEAMKEIVAHYK